MLRVVLCNCSPDESADLAEALVEQRLAACVNVVSAVTSVYRWDGQVRRDTEDTLVCKTTAARYDALEERLAELHSYDVPEIVALDSVDALDAYQRWVGRQTDTK